IAVVVDRGAVERKDDVTLLEPGLFRRAVLDHVGDDRALFVADAEAGGEIGREVLDLNAQPTAGHGAGRPQLLDDRSDGRSRDGKSNADRSARGREDRAVHADDTPRQVERGTARIALVDGRIDLDEVRIRTVADVASNRGDDAG